MAETTTRSVAELFETEIARVWNEADTDAVDDLYAGEFDSGTVRTGADSDALQTPAEIARLHEEWDAAFPDMEVTVEARAVEGDTLLAMWRATGTHEGTFRGIEPTGRTVDVTGFSYRRVEDGKYASATDQVGMYELLSQLGIEGALRG